MPLIIGILCGIIGPYRWQSDFNFNSGKSTLIHDKILLSPKIIGDAAEKFRLA